MTDQTAPETREQREWREDMGTVLGDHLATAQAPTGHRVTGAANSFPPRRHPHYDIADERAAQDAKWGEQNHPDGTGPAYSVSARQGADSARRACQDAAADGTLTWRHILVEEVAEALAEGNPVDLRTELVQVGAVVVAWIEALDRHAIGSHRRAAS